MNKLFICGNVSFTLAKGEKIHFYVEKFLRVGVEIELIADERTLFALFDSIEDAQQAFEKLTNEIEEYLNSENVDAVDKLKEEIKKVMTESMISSVETAKDSFSKEFSEFEDFMKQVESEGGLNAVIKNEINAISNVYFMEAKNLLKSEILIDLREMMTVCKKAINDCQKMNLDTIEVMDKLRGLKI